jgi:hypothetical protein
MDALVGWSGDARKRERRRRGARRKTEKLTRGRKQWRINPVMATQNRRRARVLEMLE